MDETSETRLLVPHPNTKTGTNRIINSLSSIPVNKAAVIYIMLRGKDTEACSAERNEYAYNPNPWVRADSLRHRQICSAANGLTSCDVSFPAVSYSPSAEENINISPCFRAPRWTSCEHNRDIHYSFCQTLKTCFSMLELWLFAKPEGGQTRGLAGICLFKKAQKSPQTCDNGTRQQRLAAEDDSRVYSALNVHVIKWDKVLAAALFWV